MSRIFFVAGESSGDIHGSNLIRALRRHAPDLACEGLGGTRMAAAGMELRYDLAAHAIMGFTEVVRSLGMIRRLFKDTVAHLRAHPPDALVLIDYPGFNIRLAKAAHKLGIRVVYYISPQVWAWKKGRVKTLARIVDKMLVILPFEKEIYDAVDLPCAYVGHPLIDHIQEARLEGRYAFELTIGILPGSRAQEIERILPVMLETARILRERHPEARFVAPCVDAERAEQIRAVAGEFPLEVGIGESYEVLSAARFCLVASGTATVEAALFQAPMVVLYKTSAVTYYLARLLTNVDTIGMVNILAGRTFVPEFVQNDAVPSAIAETAMTLIDDSPERRAMLDELARVKELLGGGGASENAARAILACVDGRHG